ncbi:MAG: hypothetical protein IBX71_04510 [Candidatus Desulforudis sp.]|nr:hypothetical protein [Desulforudis sp.]
MTIWPSLVLILSGLIALLASIHFKLGTLAILASVLVIGFGGLTFLVIWAKMIGD